MDIFPKCNLIINETKYKIVELSDCPIRINPNMIKIKLNVARTNETYIGVFLLAFASSLFERFMNIFSIHIV